MTQASSSKSSTQTVEAWLINQLAENLSLDPQNISTTEPLTRYGLDSIDAVTMVGDLEDWLDLELPSTLFWDYPTIAQTAQYLAENHDLAAAVDEAEAVTEADNSESTAKKGKGWGGLFGGLKGA